MDIEKYVYETFLKPIIHTDKEGEYILEEDYDKMSLSYNERKFIDDLMKKQNIALKKEMIERKDRPSTVSNFEYGEREATGTQDKDVPVIADIEYNEYGNLVFEDYKALDDFLEKVFIPDNVTLKRKVKSDELCPFVTLGSIVKLRLSEAENKHILEYLADNGINVRGKNQSVDGEFENYDYYQTYKSSILPETLSQKEQNELFELYYMTKDPVIREKLIISNMRLAAYVAYKMNIVYGFDINELQGYAYEGLIEAIDNYNPTYGKKFSSYGYVCIKGYILKGITELEGIKRSKWSQPLLNAKRNVEKSTGLDLADNPSLADDIIDEMIKNKAIKETDAEDFKRLIILTYCTEQFPDFEDENEKEIAVEKSSPDDIVIGNDLKETMAKVLETLTPREKIVLELRFGFYDGKPRTLEKTAQELGVGYERVRQIEAKALRKLRHPKRSREIRPYYSDGYRDLLHSEEENSGVEKTYLDDMIAKHTGQRR